MRSFTLIELIIVIIIIGILVTFAMPAFMVTQEKALTKEAIANLKLIAAAEKVYRMNNAFYYPKPCPPTEGDIIDINNYLKLYFTDETNWDYAITVATAGAFTATAQRTGGSYPSCKYTIDQSTAEPTVVSSTTCP